MTAVAGQPRGRLWPAVHAEWTKLRTVASPAWLAVGMIVFTVAAGALIAGAPHCSMRHCSADGTALYDTTKLALSGVQVGQAVVAVLAVLAVGGEYGTGMVRTTLAAVPRRGVVLAAKAAVITGGTLVVAAAGVAGSVLVARPLLARHGFTASNGYAPLSLTDPTTLRAVGGSVLYLALVALLGVGIAVAVRDSAVAIGSLLGLLYLFPIVSGVVTDPHWQRRLHQISPSEAGLTIQTTIDVYALPIGPWAGLGVLALWAAGALLLGWIVLRLRDA